MSYSTGQGGHARSPEHVRPGAYTADAMNARWADAPLSDVDGFMVPEDAASDPHGSAVSAPLGSALRNLAHGAAALGSLALVVWIGVWGYGQVMRDVSGVPVVQALEGPMRDVPERPGGRVSDNVGLAVNSVKAGTPDADLSETVRLAPSGPDLAEDDMPIGASDDPAAGQDQQPGAAPRPAVTSPGALPIVDAALVPVDGALDAGQADAGVSSDTAARQSAPAQPETDAEALARALTEGLAPLAAEAAATGDTLQPVPASVPGVRSSPRPPLRPDRLSRIEAGVTPASFTSSDATASGADIRTIEPGTRLVQLGAFDTVEEARANWGSIAVSFGSLMEDKARVLQQAEAGGRAFWRLRAAGFDDLADARRFCAALVAKQTECIPVVAR